MGWARTTHRRISRLALKRVGHSIPETPSPWFLPKPSCTRMLRLIPACRSSISIAGGAGTSRGVAYHISVLRPQTFYGFKVLENRPGRTLLPFVIIRTYEH